MTSDYKWIIYIEIQWHRLMKNRVMRHMAQVWLWGLSTTTSPQHIMIATLMITHRLHLLLIIILPLKQQQWGMMMRVMLLQRSSRRRPWPKGQSAEYACPLSNLNHLCNPVYAMGRWNTPICIAWNHGFMRGKDSRVKFAKPNMQSHSYQSSRRRCTTQTMPALEDLVSLGTGTRWLTITLPGYSFYLEWLMMDQIRGRGTITKHSSTFSSLPLSSLWLLSFWLSWDWMPASTPGQPSCYESLPSGSPCWSLAEHSSYAARWEEPLQHFPISIHMRIPGVGMLVAFMSCRSSSFSFFFFILLCPFFFLLVM